VLAAVAIGIAAGLAFDLGDTLGISRTSAYLCARRREIPTVRLGRRVLVPVARFMAMLEADLPPEKCDDGGTEEP